MSIRSFIFQNRRVRAASGLKTTILQDKLPYLLNAWEVDPIRTGSPFLKNVFGNRYCTCNRVTLILYHKQAT